MSQEKLQREYIQDKLKEAIAICTVPLPNPITGDQALLVGINCLCNENYINLLIDLFAAHFELKPNITVNNTASDCLTFLFGTILARMLFIKSAKQIITVDHESLKCLFDEAYAWCQKYAETINEYWEIQCYESKRLNTGTGIPFFNKMPIYHPLQYHYLDTLENGSSQKHAIFCDALTLTNDDDKGPHQLAGLPIWLGKGPPISDDINQSLNTFIADLMEHSYHLVIANGHVSQHKGRMAFPFTAISTLDVPDFINYFGGVLSDNSPTLIIPHHLHNQSSYETKDYRVTIKRLPQYSILDTNQLAKYHHLETYSLDITIKGRTCAPYHVIVHHIQTPDNNPALLNNEQLLLIYKSVVKIKCEKQHMFIHCAAGRGRTGVIAYLLANLFINEFPPDPVQAVQWLRRYRANLIITPQQLEGAIKLSNEMMRIHKNLCESVQCENIWLSIYRHLNLITHLDHHFTPMLSRENASIKLDFFARKRKLNEPNHAALTNGENAPIASQSHMKKNNTNPQKDEPVSTPNTSSTLTNFNR